MTTLQLVTWERACVAPWPGLGVTLTMTLTLNNAQWSSVVQELEVSCPGAGAQLSRSWRWGSRGITQTTAAASAVSEPEPWVRVSGDTPRWLWTGVPPLSHTDQVFSLRSPHIACTVTSVDIDSKARFGAIKFSFFIVYFPFAHWNKIVERSFGVCLAIIEISNIYNNFTTYNFVDIQLSTYQQQHAGCRLCKFIC